MGKGRNSLKIKKLNSLKIKNVRWPGIEPGSTAWKAAMLAFTPPTPNYRKLCLFAIYIVNKIRMKNYDEIFE